MIEVQCAQCKKYVNKFPSAIERSKISFCSRECSNIYKRKDLIGKDFNDWTVKEFDCIENEQCKFICECKCGERFSVYCQHLTKGTSKRCKNCSKREYCGEVSGTYFNKVKQCAKKRGIFFDITKQDIWNQFLKQNGVCALSGVDLTWRNGNYGELGTASVDRIDSSKSYTKDNIQIVHKHINFMKSIHTQEYFLKLCESIVDYQRSKNQ